MSNNKRTSKSAAKSTSQKQQANAEPAPEQQLAAEQQTVSEPELQAATEPSSEQQAIGVALAGASIATPLLLALLDKALSFDEVRSVCRRATEIASRLEHLPEGKFALACIDDFLLTRTPVDSNPAPMLVPPETLVPADTLVPAETTDIAV